MRLLFPILALVGCVAPSVGGAQQAPVSSSSYYQDGTEALAKMKGTKWWSYEDADKFEALLANLIEFAAGQDTFNSQVAVTRYVELSFGYADFCLKIGQLERADTAYRKVISELIGAAYSAHRDRARIGVDDVREARAKEKEARAKAKATAEEAKAKEVADAMRKSRTKKK